MRQTFIALGAASAIAGAALFAVSPALADHYHHRHYHHGRGGAAAAGFAAGAILGGALAASQAPYAYAPGPGYYGGNAVAYCMRRFKSYDPASGTYLGYDGYRHPCP